ncbi:MAG: thioredoxin-disulfide reductase [bacterium]|nr:thioredoxin-disulfide reductase [bacterium]
MTTRLIIIGSGPAGLTAAIYAARANLAPLVIAGKTPGGQLMLTSEVENYPGFPNGILGPELMQEWRKQAERFGATFVNDDVTAVDFSKKPCTVVVGPQTEQADAVILATGASSKFLGLPNEKRLLGKGVSTCAVCDAFFFKGKKVAVVGGGDTAMEEALFLTKFAPSVTVIHRKDTLRASQIMADRAQKNPKISFLWKHTVEDILGTDRVSGVRVKHIETGQTQDLAVDGIFIAIGYTPNTSFLQGQIELDKKGYVQTTDHVHTSIDGVFVAGDIEDYRYRQAVTAAGDGCRAALEAEWFLEK